MKARLGGERIRHPMWHLVAARMLEFWREPAAIFWVYVFPLLMMVALGVAFRNRPVEQIRVDIQEVAGEAAGGLPFEEGAVSAGDGAAGLTSRAVWKMLSGNGRFVASVSDGATCRHRLRTGRTDLVVISGGPGHRCEYLFDPTKPGGELARNAVDDALQRAGTPQSARHAQHEVRRTGRALHRLPGTRSAGHGVDGRWLVGRGVCDRGHADQETAQAISRHADETIALPDGDDGQPLRLSRPRSAVDAAVRLARVWRGHSRQSRAGPAAGRARCAAVLGDRAAGGQSRSKRSRPFPA